MCTFENEHRVLVCDVANGRVREAASLAFQALARAAIAVVQQQEGPLAAEEPQVRQKGGR